MQHRRAFCLTGYVEIHGVKVEHPVRKLCLNNHMGVAMSDSGKARNTHKGIH